MRKNLDHEGGRTGGAPGSANASWISHWDGPSSWGRGGALTPGAGPFWKTYLSNGNKLATLGWAPLALAPQHLLLLCRRLHK